MVLFFQRIRIKFILCKTGPDPIWMAWSGFSQTHLLRKQAGVQGSSGPVSGRRQPARYQFPTFGLGCVLQQTARIMLCETSPDPILFWLTVSGSGHTDPVRKQAGVLRLIRPGSDIVLADCVGFWPNGSGPEASRCAKIIRPDSGQSFRSDPGRTRMRSGMFTGTVL